ncbi:MAG: nickel-responsive transcriptional regulator NikR [Candidatus Omnitrophica bacterium]|nr:nickel-responsive transcriptional regulator NikR [Candidatus Omnitrophota bacterium]MCM8831978.1 nickel-responsive transcriptional regulator NikR [Candidatus Omnitrophota bacterium]
MKRFGVSLDENLLKDLDNFVKEHKFSNRSQAISFFIRKNLVEEVCNKNKKVWGVLVLIYNHHKRELVNRSLEIQHNFSHIIISTQHVHLDHNNCLEIIVLSGKTSTLKKFSDKLISLKGIKYGKLLMAST